MSYGSIFIEEPMRLFTDLELKILLEQAWIAGIEYSIKLIEEEKKSPLRVHLKDPSPKFDGGGKMNEPIVYGPKKTHSPSLYHADPGSDELVCECGYREGGV